MRWMKEKEALKVLEGINWNEPVKMNEEDHRAMYTAMHALNDAVAKSEEVRKNLIESFEENADCAWMAPRASRADMRVYAYDSESSAPGIIEYSMSLKDFLEIVTVAAANSQDYSETCDELIADEFYNDSNQRFISNDSEEFVEVAHFVLNWCKLIDDGKNPSCDSFVSGILCGLFSEMDKEA